MAESGGEDVTVLIIDSFFGRSRSPPYVTEWKKAICAINYDVFFDLIGLPARNLEEIAQSTALYIETFVPRWASPPAILSHVWL